jgi:tyrosine-specific transport protein
MKTAIRPEIKPPTRLFSNMEISSDGIHHQPGSVLGSTALIAGTTVGAGILALPAVTLPSGIIPSTVLLILVWLYALISGLLIAEVTLNGMQQGQISNGLLAMAESTLGKIAAKFAGGAYLFLHYTLLVAYITQGGDILRSLFAKFLGVPVNLPIWVGTTAFALLFGGIMYFGRDKLVEKINSAFVAVLLTSFAGLLFLASGQVKISQFAFQNWTALPPAISVMLVALFYHNVIPVIAAQLEGDVKKVRQSIVIGSGIPLLMFLAWNTVILGSISPELVQEFAVEGKIFDPLQILGSGGAGEWLGVLVLVFSEFALATSFIGFVYGLLDFFRDVFNPTSPRLSLFTLILLPPMGLSILNPSIFFTALDYAGSFSTSVLGGIIPALMAWKQRQQNSNTTHQRLVPGGNLILFIIFALAIILIVKELL